VGIDIQAVLSIAFDVWTLLVAGGIFLGMRAIQKIPWLPRQGWFKRLQPLLPEAAGIGVGLAGWLPACSQQNIAIRVAAGLWCAYVAQKFRKILGQSLLGDDPIIAARVAKRENGDDSK
jgi:hypothetical protein